MFLDGGVSVRWLGAGKLLKIWGMDGRETYGGVIFWP
jgi:hypothetical protein